MTNDESVRGAISQRAAQWYVAQRAGTLEDSQRQAFYAWLQASPIHLEEYLAMAATDRGLPKAAQDPRMDVQALIQMAREDIASEVVILSEPVHSDFDRAAWPRRRSKARVVAACAVALAMATAIGVSRYLGWPAAANTYRTAHGVQQTWHLDDGSVLRLDSDSSVTVRFDSRQRRLDLDRGQALFRVAHEGRPFRVSCGAIQAVAVGTEFDVARRDEGTVIVVLKGRVAVSFESIPQHGSLPQPASLEVGPGQQVRFGPDASPQGPVPVDLRQAMGWLDHRILFEQQPLEAVAEQFNRYSALPITIDDQSLRQLRISGAFDAADIDSFVAFLSALDEVTVSRTATHIIVRRRNGGPAL